MNQKEYKDREALRPRGQHPLSN